MADPIYGTRCNVRPASTHSRASAFIATGAWRPRQSILIRSYSGARTPLGTVELGKLADLIVVGAEPLEDITNLRRLQLLLKEGRVVSDKRHLSGAVT